MQKTQKTKKKVMKLRNPNNHGNEILIFGAASIPKYIIKNNTYSPWIIELGDDYLWGPVFVDIKPLYYSYIMDSFDENFDLLKWIDQGVSKFMTCWVDLMDMNDAEHITYVMTVFEKELYDLLFPNMDLEM